MRGNVKRWVCFQQRKQAGLVDTPTASLPNIPVYFDHSYLHHLNGLASGGLDPIFDDVRVRLRATMATYVSQNVLTQIRNQTTKARSRDQRCYLHAMPLAHHVLVAVTIRRGARQSMIRSAAASTTASFSTSCLPLRQVTPDPTTTVVPSASRQRQRQQCFSSPPQPPHRNTSRQYHRHQPAGIVVPLRFEVDILFYLAKQVGLSRRRPPRDECRQVGIYFGFGL
jgi:hypothetical protein